MIMPYHAGRGKFLDDQAPDLRFYTAPVDYAIWWIPRAAAEA
jgi:hypothetical protein